jgi:hypothetical protein
VKKLFLGILTLIIFSNVSEAGTLILTCGKDAYEALEAKQLNKAEFVLKLKTRGPNAEPTIEVITDEGRSLQSGIQRLSYRLPSVTINMVNYSKYEITEIKDCNSIETGSAKMAYSRYVGGFAGYDTPVRATCSCLDREL